MITDAPGKLVHDLPFDEYLKRPAVHFSALVRGRPSMLHLHHEMTSPPTDPTPSMILGSAFGILVLEPLREKHLAVRPEFSGKGSVAAREAWNEEHAGRLILSQDQYDTARRMRDAVMAHAKAGPLLRAKGRSEVSMFWRDKKSGLDCKGRVDRVVMDQALLDLKSSASAEPDAFARSMYDYGYFIQDPFYRWGYEECGGGKLPMVFVVCENKPPHAVVVYRIGGQSRAIGAGLAEELMLKYADACRAKRFPGYADDDVADIELPLWALKRWEEAQGEAM